MSFIYLDHAATSPVAPDVAKAVEPVWHRHFGNPSSIHAKGIEAEQLMQQARQTVAQSIGAHPGEIVFTSGGTESNNLSVLGAARAGKGRGRHIITSNAEHASVMHAFEALEREGFEVTFLPVDATGYINPVQVKQALRPDTVLVSIVWVNNELGTVNPVASIVEAVKAANERTVVHTDAVQAYGKIPLDVKASGVDLFSASGHKIQAPKGVGFLYVRKGVTLTPLMYGGGQEGGLRSGTENVPGIVALGAAARPFVDNPRHYDDCLRRFQQCKDRLIDVFQTIEEPWRLNGAEGHRSAPHIINVSFGGVRGEVLVRLLAHRGLYVSTGSACSNKNNKTSHVLRAIGLPEWALEGCLRISLSPHTTVPECERAGRIIKDAVEELRG